MAVLRVLVTMDASCWVIIDTDEPLLQSGEWGWIFLVVGWSVLFGATVK